MRVKTGVSHTVRPSAAYDTILSLSLSVSLCLSLSLSSSPSLPPPSLPPSLSFKMEKFPKTSQVQPTHAHAHSHALQTREPFARRPTGAFLLIEINDLDAHGSSTQMSTGH